MHHFRITSFSTKHYNWYHQVLFIVINDVSHITCISMMNFNVRHSFLVSVVISPEKNEKSNTSFDILT